MLPQAQTREEKDYEKRISEVEHGSFMPIVLCSSSGWGPSATVVFKQLGSLLSMKLDQPYSRTLTFFQCKVTFSLLDSAIMCLRGATPSFHRPARDTRVQDQPLDLIVRPSCLTAMFFFVVCSLKYIAFMDKFSKSSCLLLSVHHSSPLH